MSRLYEIQKEFAQENGAENWFELISNIDDTHDNRIDEYYHEVYMKYLSECCKATLEKASRNGLLLVSDQVLQTSKNLNVFFEKYENGTVRRKDEIDRKSINQESNITLL